MAEICNMKNTPRIAKPVFHGEVLLCEDNKMNRDLIHDHLTRVGLTIVAAENGLEGVEAFKSRAQDIGKPFDLVFMDIKVPVMDGLEACAEILKMHTQTPIIAMTANGSPADRKEYAAHGMRDCLVKPFTSQELWACLLKYLTPVNTGAAGDAAAENPAPESDAKFQQKLMQTFISDNQNRHEEIAAAVDAGDIKLANRLAHGLKSNAGYLGKTGLQKAAENVENLLRGANNLVTPHELAALKTELDAALKDFAARVPPKPGGAAAPRVNMDTKEKWLLISKLELMLEAGNPECLQLVDGLRTLPGSEEMIAQMESFNFDAALEILVQAKRKWM
jgi:CheY-like chemotaxis protein